jgi:hypothetical protein
MKQTTKSLLGLLALAVVGIAVAFGAAWAGRDEEKKAEAKEKSEKLFDFDKAHARGLRIVKGGNVVAVLTKTDEKAHWKMEQPVPAEAEDGAVDGLVDALLRVKQKKELEGVADAKPFGLDKPALTVGVKLDDGKEQGLDVGVENGFDGTLYVRKLGEQTVRQIDSYQKAQLDKSAFDLRSKKVANLADGAEIKRIEVSAMKMPFVLQKDGAEWKIGANAADSAAADRIANALRNLRATAIAAENATLPAQFGLDLPKAVVKFTVGEATRTLTFAQPAPAKGSVAVKTYTKRDDSPVVYEVDNYALKDFDRGPAELLDKSLAHVDRDAVRKIVLESPSGRIEIARAHPAQADGGVAEEQFEVTAPSKGPAKKWKLSSALYTLASLKASSLEGPVPHDLAKYGLDKPKTVVLMGDGDKVLLRLRAGSEKDDKRYVLADGVDKLARVEKSMVDDLPWTVADALDTPAPASPPQAGKH